VRRWFERLFRLYDLRFELRHVAVSGPPWNLFAYVQWLAQVTPKAGGSYVNEGVHLFRIRRGKAVYIRAFEDSQKVADACRRMADAGIAEAAAPPITD
jgi:ketosteroid isomerase-like protein